MPPTYPFTGRTTQVTNGSQRARGTLSATPRRAGMLLRASVAQRRHAINAVGSGRRLTLGHQPRSPPFSSSAGGAVPRMLRGTSRRTTVCTWTGTNLRATISGQWPGPFRRATMVGSCVRDSSSWTSRRGTTGSPFTSCSADSTPERRGSTTSSSCGWCSEAQTDVTESSYQLAPASGQ